MVEKKIPSTGTPSTATIMISIVTHCQDPPPSQLSSPLNVYSTHLIRAPVPDGRDGQSKHDAGPGQGSVVVGPHQVHRVLGGYAALPVGVAGIVVIQ